MKSCPTCHKTFTDRNLSFCVDDGTPLTQIPDDDELTEVKVGDESNGAPLPYQPPSYVPPGGVGPQRRTWPWVVGIVSVLVLGLSGLGVAALILIPRMVKRSNPVIVSHSNANKDSNANPPANTNSNPANANTANSNSTDESTSNSPVPTDKEVVLAQLRDLEHEWTVANLNADKKKLGQILADDYVGPNADGKMQGKAEYINTVQRDTAVQKWEFEDLRLTLRGDRATLLGKVRFQVQDKELVYDFVDRFVWRDGRWQATGSEVTLNQPSN